MIYSCIHAWVHVYTCPCTGVHVLRNLDGKSCHLKKLFAGLERFYCIQYASLLLFLSHSSSTSFPRPRCESVVWAWSLCEAGASSD